ncbi:hypothetical protein H0H92_001616, partial [Tricholoma furcatifolium]
MSPVGVYGPSLPREMGYGFGMQPAFNTTHTLDKGKGKAREVDFEAAFAQIASSLPAEETTSGIVEVSDDTTGLEDAMANASLEGTPATGFK